MINKKLSKKVYFFSEYFLNKSTFNSVEASCCYAAMDTELPKVPSSGCGFLGWTNIVSPNLFIRISPAIRLHKTNKVNTYLLSERISSKGTNAWIFYFLFFFNRKKRFPKSLVLFMIHDYLSLRLEDTARYAGLLLAPAEGFGLRRRLFLPFAFGQKKSF